MVGLRDVDPSETLAFLSTLVRKPDEGAVPLVEVNGKHEFSFESEEELMLFDALGEILRLADPDLERTISLQAFRQHLARVALGIREQGREAADADWRGLISTIKSLPMEEWEIFRSVQGAQLSTESPLTLGPYTLHSLAKHEAHLNAKSRSYFHDRPLWTDSSTVLISFRAKARDFDRATQHADEAFRRFENILRFMIRDSSARYDVSVLSEPRIPNTRVLGIKVKTIATSVFERGPPNLFSVDEPRLREQASGFERVWAFALSASPTEMDRRLLAAIEWMGKGIGETDVQRSIVQFGFALELMLRYTSGSGIDPSIASQLAETAAFVLGDDLEARLEIVRDVKELYGVRSKIVHGTPSSISTIDLVRIMELSFKLMDRFLVDPELSTIRSQKELAAWGNRMRYSRPRPESAAPSPKD